MVINPLEPGKPEQLWMITGSEIRNRLNTNQVLAIADLGSNSKRGAKICSQEATGEDSQLWTLDFVSDAHDLDKDLQR